MHPIVEDEVRLLRLAVGRLASVAPPETRETEFVEALQRVQADLRVAKTDDKTTLELEYERLLKLLEQARASRPEQVVDVRSPYFAHLRTVQDGRTVDVFLGRATCLENGLRIVDWRHAPVARIFYRYAEGDFFEEDLGPRVVEGQVTARRTLHVRDSELQRVDAPQGIFVRGEAGWSEVPRAIPSLATGAGAVRAEAAGQALGQHSGKALRADKHLPDIAALIDPEQFELVSRTDSGPVVIRGGAGSGKTTVLLHRIAWLTHANPTRFAGAKMLVVVWGKALRDYVGKVLPGLGVEDVRVVTWTSWSRQLVERCFTSLPGHTGPATPDVVSRFKMHPGLPSLLAAEVAGRKAPATGEQAVQDWMHVISDRAHAQRLGFSEREVEEIALWSRRQLDLLARKREEREKDVHPWLDEEDDAILLRAWQLRVGPLRGKSGQLVYSHVAVDEVQDFCAMEIAVLVGATDAKRCITLAGDTQQHIVSEGGSQNWGGLLDAIGVESTSLSSLRVSYRSTRTITAFARALLGDQAEDDAPPLAMRDGAPVEVFDFPDLGACVDFVAQALRALVRAEPLASVAVITPDAEMARATWEGLERAEVPSLRLVEDQEFAFAPGVDVVDVEQVKGLEFDYVVVVGADAASYPDTPRARRLLHVAASRAIHQLWVTCIGAASPLVDRALALPAPEAPMTPSSGTPA